MKDKIIYPIPNKKIFNRSITKIPSSRALNDYDYALWEYGFNCAIRLIKKKLQNKDKELPDDKEMYDYISFANYFHKVKEKMRRGTLSELKRPDELFKEWMRNQLNNQ